MKQFIHTLPQKPAQHITLDALQGASLLLAIDAILQASNNFLLIITPDVALLNRLERELPFFSQQSLATYTFPDWETLPYDHFSPHPDIISERMATLYQLPRLQKGILFASVSTLMHRLPPQDYLAAHSFVVRRGEHINLKHFKATLEKSGYYFVSQVMAHGEYTMRGSILDVFPMGSHLPYRIDFLDEEVDSLRTFDPETQRTLEIFSSIQLLPAHEFPLTEDAITQFRKNWRERFNGNPLSSPLYESISRAEAASGVEYYLPLFFEKTQTLFDYLPANSLIVTVGDIYNAANHFWNELQERYEQLRHDISKPILAPLELFQSVDQFFGAKKAFPECRLLQSPLATQTPDAPMNGANALPPQYFQIDHTVKDPWRPVKNWLTGTKQRVLFCAETAGRLEVLTSLLHSIAISPKVYTSWPDFLTDATPIGIAIAPLEQGLSLENPAIALITESQLFGPQVMQRRLRKKTTATTDAVVRDLTELKPGMPVVHIDHGVGRYLGLQTIKTGDYEAEYLILEYQGGSKLYVPVTALHLIGRYTGASVENAPLNKLGSGQWEKVKRKASEKIRDVAAELLHIYARRAAQVGFACQKPDQNYSAFAASFPFETTPDQQKAIDTVIEDMVSNRCMDRVVCGDVGFGKTEVAMRAAFLATQSHQQVAVLVPTTLLAEQHCNTFQDRFAKWPLRIEALSRFRTAEEQKKILHDLQQGKIDIVIGTHKLLQPTIQFKALGLLIVDEEHRFGVSQKERIKALRAEVDLLTLTATPIPRTLNMALASIRDLSIIATPPAKRLSVKTFVREYNNAMIREAVMRETLRGGQVYFLHNEVETIERIAAELQVLLPETRIGIAHGQMRESQLERVMVDFYHQRFNMLLCTTIIESGIDIPTANTIIIRRADRFGLAQLHQLRGRVGRSHHQAYAYLLTPPKDALTPDAKKRLEAIAALEDLGSGFLLATQDLEIRGAGELLGAEQSGHIQELGFSLYMSLLEETVSALKAGKEPMLDKPLQSGTEVDFKVPALIPEHYLPDVHTRLILYKRIANAKDKDTLDDLTAEMIDRFGLLPEPTQNLFKIAALKLLAEPLDIKKLHVVGDKGTIEFAPDPNINMLALIDLIQKKPQQYKFSGAEKLHLVVKGETLEQKITEVQSLLQLLKKN
jgi:transcription-repair coupling factor (superfamily II helicase)